MQETGRLSGQVLQKTYRLKQVIGRGNAGTVYEAAHLRMSRNFAIELLDPAAARNPSGLATFWREAEAVSSLGHPHILQVFDFNQTPDGVPYVVTELLEGESLAQRLKRLTRMDVTQALAVFKQSCSALQAAHESGVVHGNLKPQNIFLCTAEQGEMVKVVGFGISKLALPGTPGGGAVRDEVDGTAPTGRMAPVESLFYLAPEQILSVAKVSPVTDVYAMGAVLYEMLAGRPPFTHNSIPLLSRAITAEPAPPLRSVRGDIPEGVARVVERALAKQQKDRFASMNKFWQELVRVAGPNLPRGPTPLEVQAVKVNVTEGLVGKKVGNYLITAVLGEGGMGAVYQAEHPEIGRQVAVKVLGDHLMQNRTAGDRFIAEAKMVARLEHPNIIDIYDFGRLEDGRPYYVMEFLKGRELSKVMEEYGKMLPGEVLPYLEQICGALQAAHEHGVIHRDMKPENVFVLDRDPPFVKILDFGIAKLLEPDARSAHLTATGMVMGSPLTIAPEQAAGTPELISPRTDLYSLGVMIYWMLSGLPPFYGLASGILVAKHITEAPQPLGQREPSVPEAVAAVVDRCLVKDPLGRPESAAELVADFKQAVMAFERASTLLPPSPAQRAASEGATPVVPPGRAQPAASGEPAPVVPTAPGAPAAAAVHVPVTTLEKAAGEVAVVDQVPRRSMLKWVGLSAVVLCAFAVGFVVVAFSVKKDEGEASKPAAVQKQEPAAVAPPAPTPKKAPASPPVPSRVKIELVLTPASARVLLDGAPTRENPLVLPRSDKRHALTISAKGYEAEQRTIVAGADQTLKVSLKKKAPARPSRPAVVATPRPATKTKTKKKPEPKKPAPAAERPAAKKPKTKKRRGPRFDDLEQDSPRFDQL